jgi:hypothetical protein
MTHAIFYAIGLIIGGGGGMVMAQSFAEDHPPKTVYLIAVPLALVTGLVLGWALNAWIDYIHSTATSPM